MNPTPAEHFPPPDWRRCTPPAAVPRVPLLYEFPGSLACRQVKLALAEKGLDWRGLLVNRLTLDHLAPDYLGLNPRGEVPTLVDGDCVVYDTVSILRYVDERLPGPPLTPADPAARQRMDQWLEVQRRLPMPELELALAGGWRGHFWRHQLRREAVALNRRLRRHTGLADHFQSRLDEVLRLLSTLQSRGEIRRQVDTCAAVLTRLEGALAAHPFAAGEDFSLADAAFGPALERMAALRMDRLWGGGRLPRVADYLDRLRARPAFARILAEDTTPARRARVWLPYLSPRLAVAVLVLLAAGLSLQVLL